MIYAMKNENVIGGRAVDAAKVFLVDCLRGNSRPSAEVKCAAKLAGVGEKALKDARVVMGCRSRRIGGKDGYCVIDPPSSSMAKETPSAHGGVSFRLSLECREMLKSLASQNGLTQTAVLEVLVRRMIRSGTIMLEIDGREIPISEISELIRRGDDQ